jgi:hypothetical protein
MKPKRIILKLLMLSTIFKLLGCSGKTNSQTQEAISADKESFTLYRKTDKFIDIVRGIITPGGTFDLLFYEIDISTPEGAKQKFLSVQHLGKGQVDIKKNELISKYNWKPFKSNDVLFIQIKPDGFKDEMELLDKRQAVEEKLNVVLERKHLGEWFAGDLGPGGGNMLYTISDLDKSVQVVLNFLHESQLDNRVLIGRRVKIDNEDWFYEVIFPAQFSGYFNTM